MTNTERKEARRNRKADRRRRNLKKRIRKPWLIFRRLIKRDLFEDVARAATGLDDFGHPYYGVGLDKLLDSLRLEASLTFLGRIMAQRAITIALKQRLLLEDLRKRDRLFFERPLIPPIIVTGLPRTGTTLLHRLLAEDPDSHAPSLEKLVAPVRPESGLAAYADRNRLAIELLTLRLFTKDLDTMHLSRIDAPEECMFAMSMSFRSMLFWTLSPCYSYMDWYSRSARTRKYRDYRDILMLLQAQARSRRLVLKAPDHLGSVGELLEAVPEALVVVCHRRTPDAVTSFNSLIHALHQTVSSSPDPLRIGETNLFYFDSETRRYVEARKTSEDRILEIDYDALTADPISIAARIYERAGLSLSSTLRDRFHAFVKDNPKDKLGRHRYSPSDFGQSSELIAGRLAHYDIAN